MADLVQCFEDIEVIDHPFTGPVFTWSNRQDASPLARKLDKILVNSSWLQDFPGSVVEFLAPGDSDHCPAVMWPFREVQAHKPKPFKFFNFWTLKPEYKELVAASWREDAYGNSMQILFSKLKRLKPKLKDFNKQHFNDISGRVAAKREQLEKIQISNLSSGLLALEKEKLVHQELVELERAESLFYKQKSKVHWLQEGDLGTKFFHQAVAVKRKKNTIRVLHDEHGNRLEDFDSMSAEMVPFFSNLIGKKDTDVQGCSVAVLDELLGYSLPMGASERLCAEITEKEIQEALFCQGNDKSPGPDGFTACFFKDS